MTLSVPSRETGFQPVPGVHASRVSRHVKTVGSFAVLVSGLTGAGGRTVSPRMTALEPSPAASRETWGQEPRAEVAELTAG